MLDKLVQLAEAFWRVLSEIHSHIADAETPDDIDGVVAELAKLTNDKAAYTVSLNGAEIKFQQEGLGSELFSFPLVIAQQFGWPEVGEVVFLPCVVTSTPDEDGQIYLDSALLDLNYQAPVGKVYRFVEPLDK